MKRAILTAAFAASLFATPAFAEDTSVCGAGMVCANKPQTIVAALQAAGFRAQLTTDSVKDPFIKSAASGYNFDIYFYGCAKNVNCENIQFRVSYAKDSTNTVELANEWNTNKRFGQAYIEGDGSFTVDFDVTMVGGLNAKNFADVLDRWNNTLGTLSQFWKDHPSK